MSRASPYTSIQPAGGSTGQPLSLEKRLAVVQKHVALRGKKVIDCGCGSGEYVLALRERNADVWGIEYSADKVAEFKRLNQAPDRVSVGDVERIEFGDASFDVALLNEVLEHVSDDRQGLREIHRILRPGGVLIVFSPNRLYPFEIHGVFLKGSTAMVPHYIPFIPYIPLAVGNKLFQYRARNYWPYELRRRIAESGFKIIHTDYIWQTFENLSGSQPGWIRTLRPLLRKASSIFEKVPALRTFGVSQMIVAEKFSLRP